MARVNKTQFAVLGSLSVKPMSVYEIKQFIQRSVSFFWTEGEAQLYPTLKALYQKGWVVYSEEKAAKAGVKKIYSLTEAGRQTLLAWLCESTDRVVYRNELLLKVFFGNNQSIEKNIQLLKEAQREAEQVSTILMNIKNSLSDKKIARKRLPYIEITVDYGIIAFQAEIDWCKASIKKLMSQ